MNDFLALMFFKCAVLADPDGVLEVQGPNSRAGYRICFTSVRQVEDRAGSIRACVREAIAVEESGRKLAAADDLEYPQEPRDRRNDDTDLGEAFARLTPGRQRGYTLYFASTGRAKRRDR